MKRLMMVLVLAASASFIPMTARDAVAQWSPEARAQCIRQCASQFQVCSMSCSIAGQGMSPFIVQRCFDSCKARYDRCEWECG